jgi:hypothetical protein
MSTGNSGTLAPSIRREELLDLFAALIAVALLLLVFANTSGAARLLFTLVFTFFVPGRAIVSNWPRLADWSDVGMSIVLSLAPLVLIATISLWVHYWHPVALFKVEAVLSLIGLALGIIRRRRLASNER